MNLRAWQAEGRLRAHQTNKTEVGEMLALVQRDLKDASLANLSVDRRFLIAYDAALTLATIPLYCSGHETHGTGHHWMTFQLLHELMGDPYSGLADYFDLCRIKRNRGTYDRGGRISLGEVEELIDEITKFREQILGWLRLHHQDLV